MIRNLHFSLPGFLLILLFILYSCANVVAPTGGPRDEDPPVVLRSTPPNFSTNYQGQDVRIFFDEFVELRNLRQNLLVSPPLENDPEVRIRGRSIIMSVSDTLRANTTYNFFFGESIVDITEGNAIPNFQFVVSTGDYVDSLSIKGKVINALTHKPEEGVFVMMYENIYDSVPMLERPVYLTKTGKEGDFRINNMREGEFMMFALRDMNSNFLYDNPDEKIAFLDSLVSPEYFGTVSLQPEEEELQETEENEFMLNDTINRAINGAEGINDTLVNEADFITDLSDTLPEINDLSFYTLYLFQEADTVQRVLSAVRAAHGKLNIAFRIPADSVIVTEYQNPFPENWFMEEYNKKRDTLTLWFPVPDRDTLRLEISDRGIILDSVTVSMVRPAPRGRQAQQEDPDRIEYLSISAPTIASRNTQPFYQYFKLRSQTPIAQFDSTMFELYLSDTIPMEVSFEFEDKVQRTLKMTSLLEPDSAYRLFIPPGTLYDIFGNTNDTLAYTFTLNNPASYGSVIVNLSISEAYEGQYILQLLNDSMEEIVQEKMIMKGGTYRFDHLAAANFRLRIIVDENENNKWDTGRYLKGLQPERVIIFPDQIQSRVNWEVEVLWDAGE